MDHDKTLPKGAWFFSAVVFGMDRSLNTEFKNPWKKKQVQRFRMAYPICTTSRRGSEDVTSRLNAEHTYGTGKIYIYIYIREHVASVAWWAFQNIDSVSSMIRMG